MHWLDRATGSVIGFVGRRLAGSRIGLLGATRPGAGGFFERAGLPELDVAPLVESDAMELLAHQFVHLPTRVLREVAHEAQGNPLALLEFAASIGDPHDIGRRYASADLRIEPRGSDLVRGQGRPPARVDATPAPARGARRLRQPGRPRGLERDGGPRGARAGRARPPRRRRRPGRRDGVPAPDDQVRGGRAVHARRTARTRTCDWPSCSPTSRNGEATTSPRRRIAPDEDIAAAVEDGAHRTLQRGDVVGAVTRLLRAADLSPHRSDRSRRLADAAYVGAHSAGQLESSSELLRDAHRGDPDARPDAPRGGRHRLPAPQHRRARRDRAPAPDRRHRVRPVRARTGPRRTRGGPQHAGPAVPLRRTDRLLGAVPPGHGSTLRRGADRPAAAGRGVRRPADGRRPGR